MPPLTSAAADDWLKLAVTWQRLSLAWVSPTGEAVWMARSPRCQTRGSWAFETPPHPPPPASLMWKPGSPRNPHPTLRPPVFPPSLPLRGPNGLGDGLYFAPQKHIVFFSTAGYSICKGLAGEVLWISITAEVPLVGMFLPLRGGTVVSNG